MRLSQDAIVQTDARFDGSHGQRRGIVINGYKSSLFIIPIALRIGILGSKLVGQIANAVIANAPHDATALYDFVRNALYQTSQRIEI
jgi:hypothetical protein